MGKLEEKIITILLYWLHSFPLARLIFFIILITPFVFRQVLMKNMRCHNIIHLSLSPMSLATFSFSFLFPFSLSFHYFLSLSLPCFFFVLIVDLGEKFGKGLSSPIGGPREELEGPKFSQAHFFFPLSLF